jgi:protein O-mannosyl-transferase
MESARTLKMPAGVVLIVALIFLTYFPAVNGQFIWDDIDIYIVNDQIIKSADGLYQYWFTTEAAEYLPVTNSTFWTDWRLWEMNPAGYHVTNLVLHVIESLLIWLVLRKLSIPGAFFAAVLFAVHPVNVQAVAWIAQRKTLIAMVFMLLSILWYLNLCPRARVPLAAKQTLSTAHCPLPTFSSFILHPSSFYLWYWLSLAAFILAMLSKGSVAVMPVLLLGIVWWRSSSPYVSRLALLRIAPFFLVAAALTLVHVWFQTRGTGASFRDAGFLERLLGAGGVIGFTFTRRFCR